MILKVDKEIIINTSNVIFIHKNENNQIVIKILDGNEQFDLKKKCSFNKLKKILKEEFILLSDIVLLNKKYISQITGTKQVSISTSIDIDINIEDNEAVYDIIYGEYPIEEIKKAIDINALK